MCEVADGLRASGVEVLTTPPALDRRVAALLVSVGLVQGEEGQGCGSGWSQLPL
ncbi:hypothetical protein [Modestobacter sp. I12A-02662]|uniref:hypothetical protein n=1 Tax=Modestobacter sp. I12A-02662 TaxID=1730496 RepID=UPI0034DF4489